MIGLLPWEKLPPWIYGPAITASSIYVLWIDDKLHWWEYLLLPVAAFMVMLTAGSSSEATSGIATKAGAA